MYVCVCVCVCCGFILFCLILFRFALQHGALQLGLEQGHDGRLAVRAPAFVRVQLCRAAPPRQPRLPPAYPQHGLSSKTMTLITRTAMQRVP